MPWTHVPPPSSIAAIAELVHASCERHTDEDLDDPPVDVPPNQNGLPGLAAHQNIVGALLTFGLVASVAGVVISAVAWAIGSTSSNPHIAGRGKNGGRVAGRGDAHRRGKHVGQPSSAPRVPRSSDMGRQPLRPYAIAVMIVATLIIGVVGLVTTRREPTQGPRATSGRSGSRCPQHAVFAGAGGAGVRRIRRRKKILSPQTSKGCARPAESRQALASRASLVKSPSSPTCMPPSSCVGC